MKRLIAPAVLVAYGMIPVAAFVLVRGSDSPESVGSDVALSAIPLLLLATVGWRLVWPRWKLVGKLIVHPSIYAILSVYIGSWTIAVAWLHQGVFGLGVHIWFSRRHGFTWYAVEDPERYVAASKEMVSGTREVQ
ncbi:MAG: hypothetical protein RJQ04_20800 [Longimicrobiales bacterium]